MKICITGGLGYIGRHVVDNLCKKDHEVVVIDKNNYSDSKLVDYFKDKYSNFTFIHMDILKGDIVEVFRAHMFDSVVHLATDCDTDTIGDLRRNILEVTMDAYNIACATDVKTFVNCGTARAYESDFKIHSEYGFLNHMAERSMISKRDYFAQCSNLYNLRLFNIYGHSNVIPFSNHKWGLWFDAVDAKVTGEEVMMYSKTLTSDGTYTRDWSNIFDIAEIIARFAVKPSEEFIDQPHWDVGSGIGITSYLFINHFITIEDINLDIKFINNGQKQIQSLISNSSKTFDYVKFRSSVGPKLYSNSYLNGVYII